MRSLPRAAIAYILGLAFAALFIIFAGRPANADLADIAVLAALFVALESGMVVVGSVGMTLSSPVALASFILVGPWGAAVVGASQLFAIYRWGNHRPNLVKRVFNASQSAVSAYVGGLVLWLLWKGAPDGLTASDFPSVLLPIFAADAAYLTVNGLLVAGVVNLAERVPFRRVIAGTIIKSAPSYAAYGIFGLMLAVLWSGLGIRWLAAPLLLLPLLVARWAIAQYAHEQQAYEATIRTLVQAVETKDSYTRGHSERVARASVMIARIIGMSEDRVSALRYAGILHDVGKLGVPTRVLQKSGKLTEDEFAAVKLHPLRGMEMLGDIEFLDEAFRGILHHHERLDGLGYPMGLQGRQIPEFARVIAVADAFDSMTSTRSYRHARTVEEAIQELQLCKGSQFDPDMVCLLYTSPSPRDRTRSRMPSSA
jgi:hypothetical protein